MDHVKKDLKIEESLVLVTLSIKQENLELQERVSELWAALQASEEELYEVEATLAFAEKTIGELCYELQKSVNDRRVSPVYV
tara:strand:+ start:566 stop:811 length:246 start_codon:yes stop_codon:yes gene_type:complete